MGTTEFAAYILEEMIKKKFSIVAVFSQPDRHKGRNKKLISTPTKRVALENDINVYGFDNVNEHFDLFKELNPDLIITCAFGQKIGISILNLPNFGCINIHASILPKYRGGAPIHYAIMNGEQYTGNTIMYMAETLDSGDVLSQSAIKIEDDDTTSSLSKKLSIDAAQLLFSTLPLLFNRDLRPTKQDDNKVSYAPNIKRELELINFNRDINVVYNHIRGLLYIPGCYFILNNKKIKLFKVEMIKESHNYESSYVLCDNNDYFKIYCKNGYIKVFDFQVEGRKIIEYKNYVNQNKKDIVNGVIINEGVSYGY
jgi:methionyl-tRNA formyltransferase